MYYSEKYANILRPLILANNLIAKIVNIIPVEEKVIYCPKEPSVYLSKFNKG